MADYAGLNTTYPVAYCILFCTDAPMGKKKNKQNTEPEKKTSHIAENRRARHQYHVLDTLECGIVLQGSEVKSLRLGQVSLDEAYGRVIGKEVYLVGCDIPEYKQASHLNHHPRRERKLLMHKPERRKFAEKATQNGHTLVPLKMYFNHRGICKVLLGLCKGKQMHDKRQSMKKRDTQRGLDRAMRGR